METGATYVMGVPTHAIDILAEQKRRSIARLGKVSVFYMAGAAIPPSVCEAFRRPGHHAAERLRHDRKLLASIYPTRRTTRP